MFYSFRKDEKRLFSKPKKQELINQLPNSTERNPWDSPEILSILWNPVIP
jgi:hypothetical protein